MTRFFGAATHLWKQNTSNNSTFISRVRAGAAAQESLYISKFIKEALGVRTNIRTHADSSAANSITMQEGESKRNIMEWRIEKTAGTNGVLYIV